MKRLFFVNVRLWHWHVQSQRGFPFLSLYDNPRHRPGGEFRVKPGWCWCAVYRFFGRVH